VLCRVFTLTLRKQRFTVNTLQNIKLLAVRHQSDEKIQEMRNYLGLHYYQCFRIIRTLSRCGPAGIALFAMAAGCVTIILTNFTSFKLHHVISMPIFLIFPFISLICPIFGSCTIQVGAQCYEVSKEFKIAWLKTICYQSSGYANGNVSPYWKTKCCTLVPVLYF